MNMLTNIKNYQIIKQASLEFIPGLNVIIGPSNNGKSSILKAIKSALYTIPGSTPIRAGEKSYSVGINYNNHIVILQKGLKDSVYIVDNEKYTKFGQNTPQSVSEALNIKELILNGNKEQLNFWDQMEYPFLLDRSSVELFKFIVDSGDDDRVNKVLKNMVSDRQNINRDIDVLQGNINLIDGEIQTYSNQLDNAKVKLGACDKIINLQKDVNKLISLKELKSKLDSINTQLDSVKQQYSNLSDRLSKLCISFNNINNILPNTKDLRAHYFKYINLTNNLDYYISIYRNLYRIKTVDFTNLPYYMDIISYNKNIKKLNLQISSLDLSYYTILKIKKLSNFDLNKLNFMKDIYNSINYINIQKNHLNDKPRINLGYTKDDIDTLLKLKELKYEYNIKSSLKNKLNSNLDIYSKDINDLDNLKSLFDICPYCKSKLYNCN